MRRALLAGTLTCLAGCSTLDAEDARSRLIGLNQDSLLACAGIPTDRQRLNDREAVLSYVYDDENPVLSLDVLTLGSLALGAKGQCRAIFTMLDGRVAHVSYAYNSATITGPLSACAPIVRSCLKNPVDVVPPAGENPMELVGSPKS